MKLALDSSLVLAATSAILYFAGISYFAVYYTILGVPSAEFMPSVPTVTAQAVTILFNDGQRFLPWVLIGIAVAFTLRTILLIWPRPKLTKQISNATTSTIQGWPVGVAAILVAAGIPYRCAEKGVDDADHAPTRAEAAELSVYLNKESGSEVVKGRYIAISGDFIAISVGVASRHPLMLRKDHILKIESAGGSLM